jgi:hypothetical protein
MFKEDLKKFVIDNPKLVSMKPAGDGIYVLKYKKTVFFDNLWNNYLEECRGTIVDEDFNVVSRPFTKIYNYGVESKAPKLAEDTPVVAYRKINGFMVAVTWYNDDLLVSTTGSTDSPFVDMAKEMMLKEATWDKWRSIMQPTAGFTYMFECVHPNDPHIVPEEEGMYLLGWRENTWESKVDGFALATHWRDVALGLIGCKYAEAFVTTLDKLVKKSKTVKHEGFVFYTEDGCSAKIKSPHYLVSKFVARNPRTDKLMRPDVKQSMDEEYYPLIDAIQSDITAYTALDEQARLAWVRNFLEA